MPSGQGGLGAYTSNNKLLSYNNIFNKNILWIKLYDNYLYLYLNKNTNNNFNLIEELKTQENKTLTKLGLSSSSSSEGSIAEASLSQSAITVDNKIQINKNTIKLLNINKAMPILEQVTPSFSGDLQTSTVKKEIKIYKYINTISEYQNETFKYQNIVYQFNKKNKVISSVVINKNVFTLLESTFLSMSSLISKPIIIITPNKVIIQCFYYIKNNFMTFNLNSTNINNDKLQSLCLNLSKIYKKPVELELDRLHYPYYDSNILSNMIGLISNIVKLRFIIKKLFNIVKIKKTNNSSIIMAGGQTSYLSGIKIRIAGRLLTQRVIPRLTVKTIQRGTLARGKTKFVDSARFINKNKRGSYSITVTMGHIFY